MVGVSGRFRGCYMAVSVNLGSWTRGLGLL